MSKWTHVLEQVETDIYATCKSCKKWTQTLYTIHAYVIKNGQRLQRYNARFTWCFKCSTRLIPAPILKLQLKYRGE